MVYTDIHKFYAETGGFKPGDIALTWNPDQAIVGKIIIRHQNWISPDRKSEYSHALLITNKRGITFESGIKIKGKAFHRIGSQNLFEAYKGYNVKVIRHEVMTESKFWEVFPAFAEKYNHNVYPYWRLPLYFVPPIARRLHFINPVVCSELVSCFYYEVKDNDGNRLMRFYLGVYPDYLSDMGDGIYGQKRFTTVFNGKIFKPYIPISHNVNA